MMQKTLLILLVISFVLFVEASEKKRKNHRTNKLGEKVTHRNATGDATKQTDVKAPGGAAGALVTKCYPTPPADPNEA